MIFPRCYWAALGLLVIASPAFAQGPIVPTGTPGPTMKTLDQVEARKPVPAGALASAYLITEPGSYYLTGNIAVTDANNGVTIQADNVTLDLNGFTISNTSTNVDPSAANGGVNILGARTNVTVRNGSVVSTTTVSGTTFSNVGFYNGVFASALARNVLVEGVSVQGTRCGIMVFEVDPNTAVQTGGGVVLNCRVNVVATTGITAALIKGCTALACGTTAINGIMVSDCFGSSPGGSGITGSTVSQSQGESSASSVNTYGIRGVTVLNCYGSHMGVGVGLNGQTVTGSRGISFNGNGLTALSATTCFGTSTSAIGLETTIANNCYGATSTGTGLKAVIAVACTANAGSGGTPFAITNKYNMP